MVVERDEVGDGVEGEDLGLGIAERRGEPGVDVPVTSVLDQVHPGHRLLDEAAELEGDRRARFGDPPPRRDVADHAHDPRIPPVESRCGENTAESQRSFSRAAPARGNRPR